MTDAPISRRQLLTLTFAALLSPAVRVLPAETARRAGEAGWLSALAALPVVLALCWVLRALLRSAGGDMTLAIRQAAGGALGKVVIALYLLWGLFLLAANARLVALRFLSVGYRNGPMPLYVLAVMALVFFLVRRPVRVLGRAGEVFYLALAIGLGFSLIMGLFQIQPVRALPVWSQDVPGLLSAAVAVLGVFGYAVFAAFLAGSGEDTRRSSLFRWAGVFCLILTLLQLVCIGSFGAGLTERMHSPFFMMVKGIGIRGTFQRVESVILALWVLSDLALLALLACACSVMAQALLPVRRERAVLPVAALGAAGGLWLFPSAFALGQTMVLVGLPGSLIMGFGLPLALWIALRLRQGGKKAT